MTSKKGTKVAYDRQARLRVFNAGNRVFVFTVDTGL